MLWVVEGLKLWCGQKKLKAQFLGWHEAQKTLKVCFSIKHWGGHCHPIPPALMIVHYYVRSIQCPVKNVENLKGNYVPWRQFVTILPTWAILLVFVDHSDCETKLGLEYKSQWQSMHLPRCERYLYNQNVLFFFFIYTFLRFQKMSGPF